MRVACKIILEIEILPLRYISSNIWKQLHSNILIKFVIKHFAQSYCVSNRWTISIACTSMNWYKHTHKMLQVAHFILRSIKCLYTWPPLLLQIFAMHCMEYIINPNLFSMSLGKRNALLFFTIGRWNRILVLLTGLSMKIPGKMNSQKFLEHITEWLN